MNINYGSNVFVVPAVVNEYLNSATPEQLKVILYVLQFPEKSVSSIADSLQLSAEKVENALQFWISQQVLQSTEKGNLLPASDMPFAVDLPEEKPKIKSAPKKSAPQVNISPSRLADELEKFPDLKGLMQHAESVIFGRTLNYMEQQDIIIMHQGYGLSLEIVAMLLDYCGKIQRGITYAKSIALSWHENEITTVEEVEKELDRMTKQHTFTGQIRKMFELTRKPTPKQQSFIDSWELAGYSMDLIEYAYHQTLENTDTKKGLSFEYINKILVNLAEQGITTPEQAKEAWQKNMKRQVKTITKVATTSRRNQFIDAWEKSGYSVAMIQYAYEQAVEHTDQNRGLSFEYMNAVLENCAKNNLTTPEQAEQYHKEHPVIFTKFSKKKEPKPMTEQEIEEMNEYLSLMDIL